MAAGVASAMDGRRIRDAHVMGYSHGGAVAAQQLARDAPHLVRPLALAATYAHNTATARERMEGRLAPHLVRLLGIRLLARALIRPGTGGGPPLTPDQVRWLRGMLGGNHTAAMALAAAELSASTAAPGWAG